MSTIETTVRATPGERWTEGLAVLLSLGYTWGYLQGWTPWCFLPAALGAGLLALHHGRRARQRAVAELQCLTDCLLYTSPSPRDIS